jgi:hypothetical protein
MLTLIWTATLIFLLLTLHIRCTNADDNFCQEQCASLSSCNKVYGQDFVDLRLREDNFPIDNGPGKSLVKSSKDFGNTVSRQTFETQFILDIAAALDTSPCHFYITEIFPEGNDNYWDSESVFVTFRLFPARDDYVARLTRQIQEPASMLYDGIVTRNTDHLYGLYALPWDFTFKLMYSISIIGHSDVIQSSRGRYLNQGSLQLCMDTNNDDQDDSKYCMFERYLINDMERALLLESGQFQVLFIKEADRQSVVVSFRLIPIPSSDKDWAMRRVEELLHQISDSNSLLHQGNVTYKMDPVWGISQQGRMPRNFTTYVSRPIPATSPDAYERCKATHRCPRAWSSYNQSSSEASYTLQEFRGGEHLTIPLFLDFEDWRRGTRGWKQSCRKGLDDDNSCLPESAFEQSNQMSITGAYWSPYDFESLGPSIPTARDEWNNGLVLNNKTLELDVHDQTRLIEEYATQVKWMDKEFQYGVTDDANIRAREEIRRHVTDLSEDILTEKRKEELKLDLLVKSQCTEVSCSLLFNTSDATLTGAINSTGVIATTPDGTEVALWAFESIDIDENVNITLTGQRALSLVSRTSVRINTTLHAYPGTLGGFPGGYSVARRPSDRLVRVCSEQVDSRGFLDACGNGGESQCCPGDQPISVLANSGIKSNNINGPGSPSSRVYLFTIQTSAPIVSEIQTLTSTADDGQTLSGGFRLHLNNYSTSLLPHDISAIELKRRMEDALNPTKKNRLDKFDRLDMRSGIGVVDVVRDRYGTSGGYQWKITFQSAVGDLGKDSSPLKVSNLLVSKGADISLETIRNGNTIGGTFALRFLGNMTRPISHDVSAAELKEILLNDIDSLSTVDIIRSDPTDNCHDGFCRNGPGRSGGYSWTLTLTTQIGNISPVSPTSSEFDHEGLIERLEALNYLTGCVDSDCPSIHVESGHSNSHNHKMRSIMAKKPFSLAYGGAGAAYGGKGGNGFGHISAGKAYGDERITNLHGGSGGGVAVDQPFQLGILKGPRGRGGSGGGAIKILAANDIVIGSHAVISCAGEQGADGYSAGGGGGSGGSILLVAGGSIQIDGRLSVAGGDGGRKKSAAPMNRDGSFGGHGGAGSGGRIALYGESVLRRKESVVELNGGNCSATPSSQECSGGSGTLFIVSRLDTGLVLDPNSGAAGTRSSLYLSPRLSRVPFDSQKLLSSSLSSPEYDLGSLFRPGRVSFFYRTDTNQSSSKIAAAFELRESRWSYLSSKTNVDFTAVVGIFVGQDEVRHGVNYIGIPYNDEHIKGLDILSKNSASSKKAQTWSKVEILFNWENRTHDIYINDIRLVNSVPFQGEGIRAVSLSNFHEGVGVWFDEITVGIDTTMDFRCPRLVSGTLLMDRPIERGWKLEDVGEVSSTHPMSRHESHISRRPLYQRDDGKFYKPFDGLEDRAFTSDVKFRDGDREHKKGSFHAGSLLRLPTDTTQNDAYEFSIGKPPDTYVWYGEHDDRNNNSKDPSKLSGAIMACSTQDFVEWKSEGAMLNFANLTDMVDGSSSSGNTLRAEKPKVLYNNSTQKYVMWMIIDNGTRDLGMAGVAVSDYYSGPFHFVRSFYPDADGNQTHDQTVFQDDDGTAYLFRTYFASVDYVVPEAVMQPTWESVKNADGSVNFALSYHRAEYDKGYDDYHDIYLQRWRTEDKPWKVICVNRISGEEREVPYGKEHLNYDGEVCQDPYEYKRVLGQGNPNFDESKNGIKSRFLDPHDPSNNVWVPNSVPSVQGQTWRDNFEDGTCGKIKVDGDMHFFDPDLPNREIRDRSHCSNLVDNPVHSTQPDKRIGPSTVLERRRTKYVAVSRLTDDYLDTTGVLKAFEGDLLDDLSSIVKNHFNDTVFGWSSGENVSSTFHPNIHDDHFSQEN